MKQKHLTKTFMMISNWKKIFDLHDLYKHISALQGWTINNDNINKVVFTYDWCYLACILGEIFWKSFLSLCVKSLIGKILIFKYIQNVLDSVIPRLNTINDSCFAAGSFHVAQHA